MKKNIENTFVFIALLFGFITIILLPPFQSPDESSHYMRAYSISRGQLYSKLSNNQKVLLIEDELSNYIDKFIPFVTDINHKFSYSELYFDQEIPKSITSSSYKTFSTVDTPFISYIPSSIGIIVSKLFRYIVFHSSTTYAYSLYFARLFNLLFYIMIMYFAIKKTPILKKTMITIGLLPMSIMLASSVSYDGLIISCSCLLFANIFYLIFDNKAKFSRKQMVLFTILGFILFVIKYVYVLLLLLLFFIPIGKFNDKRDKYKKVFSIFAMIFGLYVVFNIPNYLNSVSGSANEQLKFIFANPFKYLYILFSTMLNKFGLQLSWILGGFGNLDTHFPGFIYFIMFIYLIVLFLFDSSIDKYKINKKFKIIVTIILFTIICGIYTALYLIWTGVGSNTIEGVQGRYFLPIIIFTPLLSFGNKLSLKYKNINSFFHENFQFFSFIFLTIYSVLILVRFWC